MDAFREYAYYPLTWVKSSYNDSMRSEREIILHQASTDVLRLFVNSQLLRGIRESTDVINMPEEKRTLAIRAMRNAQRCIDICLRGENVRTA